MSAGSFRLFEIVGVKLQKKSAIFGSILGPDGTKVRSRKNCAFIWNSNYNKKSHSTGAEWLFQQANKAYFAANLANFLLNLSIRPAVSTNFILPVKNGWL
jgi:hypothetical protein